MDVMIGVDPHNLPEPDPQPIDIPIESIRGLDEIYEQETKEWEKNVDEQLEEEQQERAQRDTERRGGDLYVTVDEKTAAVSRVVRGQ